MRFAYMGAHVIKVEPPVGDPAKVMSGGIVHLANNKGKEYVTIDLKTVEGKVSMIQLIKKSDVLLDSFRPGAMKRLGFDYDSVKALKPDINVTPGAFKPKFWDNFYEFSKLPKWKRYAFYARRCRPYGSKRLHRIDVME